MHTAHRHVHIMQHWFKSFYSLVHLFFYTPHQYDQREQRESTPISKLRLPNHFDFVNLSSHVKTPSSRWFL